MSFAKTIKLYYRIDNEYQAVFVAPVDPNKTPIETATELHAMISPRPWQIGRIFFTEKDVIEVPYDIGMRWYNAMMDYARARQELIEAVLEIKKEPSK